MFGGWQIMLVLSPVIIYLAAGGAINRTEILIETKHVAWKARPLPLGEAAPDQTRRDREMGLRSHTGLEED